MSFKAKGTFYYITALPPIWNKEYEIIMQEKLSVLQKEGLLN
jgi:hypothetical protein